MILRGRGRSAVADAPFRPRESQVRTRAQVIGRRGARGPPRSTGAGEGVLQPGRPPEMAMPAVTILTGELRSRGRGDGRRLQALGQGSGRGSAPRPRPSSAAGNAWPPFDFEAPRLPLRPWRTRRLPLQGANPVR